MFEVGARYEFKMLEDGAEATFSGVVEKYEHPLLKLADHAIPRLYMPGAPPGNRTALPSEDKMIPGQIINVTSPSFISAQRKDRDN